MTKKYLFILQDLFGCSRPRSWTYARSKFWFVWLLLRTAWVPFSLFYKLKMNMLVIFYNSGDAFERHTCRWFTACMSVGIFLYLSSIILELFSSRHYLATLGVCVFHGFYRAWNLKCVGGFVWPLRFAFIVAWGTKKRFIFEWARSHLQNQNPPCWWIFRIGRIMSKPAFFSL